MQPSSFQSWLFFTRQRQKDTDKDKKTQTKTKNTDKDKKTQTKTKKHRQRQKNTDKYKDKDKYIESWPSIKIPYHATPIFPILTIFRQTQTETKTKTKREKADLLLRFHIISIYHASPIFPIFASFSFWSNTAAILSLQISCIEEDSDLIKQNFRNVDTFSRNRTQSLIEDLL